MSEEIATPGPGVYSGTPMGDYHRWRAASNSQLSRLARSPAHLRAYLTEPHRDTPALLLGRAIHCAVLEPDLFRSAYVLAEQCAAKTKAGARCSNSGLFVHREVGWVCGVHVKGFGSGVDASATVLSPEDYRTCEGVRDSAHRSRSVRGLLTGSGEVELSMVWEDRESGVTCKARWDRHSPDLPGGAVVDLKTCRDASSREFERSIFSYGYHIQGAHYLAAGEARRLPARHYVIVAAEKEPPYAVAAYRLTEGAIQAGGDQLRPLLALYAQLQGQPMGEWPAYPDRVRDVSLPDWAWRVVDERVREMDELAA